MNMKTFLPVFYVLLLIILALSASAQLDINNVDFDSPGRGSEVKPNELATVTFEIENDGEDKIKNIDVLVYFERNGRKLDDNTGDDFELKSDIDYIRGGKSKDIEFTFNIPFDVEDGQRYTVVVEVEGKNSTSSERYNAEDRSEDFEIIRDRHELLFYKLDIAPTTIKCDRLLNIDYDIRNIGERDEDINLSMINNILGINVTESFSLEKEYDEDNRWEKSHSFLIDEAVPAGIYGLTINLNYETDEHQYNTTQITVEGCDAQNSNDTSGNDTMQDQGTAGTAQPGNNVDVVFTQTPAVSVPAIAPQQKKSGVDTTVILVVTSILAVLILIVILVVVLVRK